MTVEVRQLFLANLWSRATVFLLSWFFLGVVFALQLYLSSMYFASPISWWQAFRWSVADWFLWGAFSLPIAWLSLSVPLSRRHWWESAVVHFTASLLVGILYIVVRAWIGQFQRWAEGQAVSFPSAFFPLVVKSFVVNVIIYWALVLGISGARYYRDLQVRNMRAADLEKRLSEARLLALQMQLNPHFLFNTLNAVSSLMRRDVDAADRMISRFSGLLRHALESTAQQVVRLEEEIEFLKTYLEMESMRFGDRLCLEFEIPADCHDALVPNLILQPLAENAIQYGIEPYAQRGTVTVTARQQESDLVLTVTNSGPAGIQAPVRDGIGLQNCRLRLEQLYGARQSLEAAPLSSGGFRVVMRFPCQFDRDPGPIDGESVQSAPRA